MVVISMFSIYCIGSILCLAIRRFTAYVKYNRCERTTKPATEDREWGDDLCASLTWVFWIIPYLIEVSCHKLADMYAPPHVAVVVAEDDAGDER